MSGGHDKQWAAKSSMSRFGTFSTPSFAGVHDTVTSRRAPGFEAAALSGLDAASALKRVLGV